MWIILLLLVIGTAVSIFMKSARCRRRRKRLAELGRVRTWSDFQHDLLSVRQIVQTDFGFGKEVWVLGGESNDIDLELRAFKTGFLILPAPRFAELEVLCQSQGIELIHSQVK